MAYRRIRPMAEGGILTAVAILFAFMSAYLPLIGAFVNLIWPLPIILLGVRHGYKWALLTTAAVGVLIALLMHPMHAVSIVVGFGLIGIVLGHAIRAQYGPMKTLLAGGAASLLSKAALFAIAFLVTGISPFFEQTDIAAKALTQSVELYQMMGMQGEQLEQMKASMAQITDMVRIILPAGLLMAALLDTYINYLVARLVLRKLGHVMPEFPPFSRWRLPGVFAYCFVLALVMLYWGQSRDLQLLKNIAMNLQVISSAFLFVQGLSLSFFLLQRFKVSRFLRGLLIFFIVTNGFLTQVLILAGAFDMVLDYRKIRDGDAPEK